MTENNEDLNIYVCILAVDWNRNLFPDNKFGNCQSCQEMIVFRPDAPDHMPKVCHVCAMKYIKEAKSKGDKLELKAWNKGEVSSILEKLEGMNDEDGHHNKN